MRILLQLPLSAQIKFMGWPGSGSLQAFIESINTELAQAVDKVIMVYVHGTKVDFANSIILTAEVDHFAGRDFVGVAFAWPSHQNILSYLLGRIPGGRENRRGFYR
jgi:esterase/lipase superfamily enzyme